MESVGLPGKTSDETSDAVFCEAVGELFCEVVATEIFVEAVPVEATLNLVLEAILFEGFVVKSFDRLFAVLTSR